MGRGWTLEFRQARSVRQVQVQLSEAEIRQLCTVSREIFLQQPNLFELEAPIKICGFTWHWGDHRVKVLSQGNEAQRTTSEAVKEIQRLLERCDGVSSNSPASLFSVEAMDPPLFLGKFGIEGFGNIFYVPENNYNHGTDWVNLI